MIARAMHTAALLALAFSFVSTACADEGSDLATALKRNHMISAPWTAFARQALMPLKAYIGEFEDIDVNGDCAGGEKNLCIFIVDFEKSNDKNPKGTMRVLQGARSGIVAVGANIIIADRILMDIMLLNITKEWEQFGRWYHDILGNETVDRRQYEFYKSVVNNLYSWRFLHVKLLKKSLHRSTIYQNSKGYLKNLSKDGFSEAFGTGISWIVFHEIGHLLQQRKHNENIYSKSRYVLLRLFNRNFSRVLEDEADAFALEKLKLLEQSYSKRVKEQEIDVADYFQVALSISGTISWLRFRALDLLFDEFRGIDVRDHFFRTHFRACERFARTMYEDADRVRVEQIEPESEENDDLDSTDFKDFVSLTEGEFKSIRARYLDIALHGTHGFEYHRIEEAIKLFKFENGLVDLWIHNSPMSDKLMEDVADGRSQRVRDSIILPDMYLSYGVLATALKYKVSKGRGAIVLDVEHGSRCLGERCEVWTFRSPSETILVGEVNFNPDTDRVTSLRFYVRSPIETQFGPVAGIERCTPSNRCLFEDVLESIKFFGDDMTYFEKFSPEFQKRLTARARALMSSNENTEHSVLDAEYYYINEVKNEVLLKAKLCGNFSFVARRKNSELSLTKAEKDGWMLIDLVSVDARHSQRR